MLEFLGFIALLSIMFGVSFGDALGGFVRFVVIGICAILALALAVKILSTKTGSIFLLVLSIAIVALGVVMINDNYTSRYSYCSNIQNTQLYSSCAINAMDSHNETVNMGWGYAIGGGILGLVSLGAYGDKLDENKNKPAKIN